MIFNSNSTVLKEQIDLIRQGSIIGTIITLLITGVLTYISYQELSDIRIIIWFIVFIFACLVWLIKQHITKHTIEPNSPKEATREFAKTILVNIIYCYLPLTFIDNHSSTTVILSIAIATGGLSCGAVSSLGPCWPILCAYIAPKMLALIASLALLYDDNYYALIFASTLFLLGMLWFGKKTENTIIESIELRLRNDKLIKKLQSALQQKDEANKSKSMFLASASHDLRQPLHALALLGESLESMQLNKQQFEVQQHMMSAIESTRTMLDSFLDISRLDAKAIIPSPKPFFIQTVFNKLESELATTANEKNLIYRTRETISAAYADPLIVELMIRNLISNAIQYTKDGGLLVACRPRQNGQLVIEVWDTGIGIPEDKRHDIFNEFLQLANPERDSAKGFGLGLAIAKGLAKTIDTYITVESTTNKGSVFRFALPSSQAEIIEDVTHKDEKIDFSGKSVLIIDDNQHILLSMQKLITNWGCQEICAESEEQALEKIKNKEIDIMLVDYRLREGKTGREAINKIRKTKQKNIPAIIITGDTAAERIREAQAVDAILMHKPVSAKQLMKMMNILLS